LHTPRKVGNICMCGWECVCVCVCVCDDCTPSSSFSLFLLIQSLIHPPTHPPTNTHTHTHTHTDNNPPRGRNHGPGASRSPPPPLGATHTRIHTTFTYCRCLYPP
jgi:hypothetical protein